MYSQIPDEFRKYSNKKSTTISQNGKIRMKLEGNRSTRTFIKDLETKAPLLIQKAIYPNALMPNTAYFYLMSSAGGILEGDNLSIDVTCSENTSAHITTQSATKIYKMKSGYATQNINILSQKGSYLEFIPNQIIPFKSSRFYQEVNLKVESNCTVIYSEIISAGRIAAGEKFDFDICFLRMTVTDENDKLVFSDVMNMELKDKMEYESLFGNHTNLATLYIISDCIDHTKIENEINTIIKNSLLLSSSSFLPYNSGVIVRMLSNSIDEIVNVTKSIIDITRTSVNHSYKTGILA